MSQWDLPSIETEYSSEDYYMLYDEYIYEMARGGFTYSLADEMQSLGFWTSQIGSRLSFQMLPKELIGIYPKVLELTQTAPIVSRHQNE